MFRHFGMIAAATQERCYWKTNEKKQKTIHSEISFTAELRPLGTGAQWS